MFSPEIKLYFPDYLMHFFLVNCNWDLRATCILFLFLRLQLSPNGAIQYELPKGVFLRKSEWKVVDHTTDMYCLDGGVTQPNPGSNCSSSTGTTSMPKRFSGKQPVNENITDILIPPNCGLTNLNEADTTSVLFICIQDDQTYSAVS